MNLRLKIICAFLVIVALFAAVGTFVTRTTRQIHDNIEGLSRHSGVNLWTGSTPVTGSVEIEVDRDASGALVASEVDAQPGARRPKVRGPVDRVDAGGSFVVIFGRTIQVDGNTEFDAGHGGGIRSIRPGVRAEVSCSVGPGGHWLARRVRLSGIKSSDKVKGTVTGSSIDGIWPDTLEVSGLPVLVGREKRIPGGLNNLHRIAVTTRMSQSLLTILTGARVLADADSTPVALHLADERMLVSPRSAVDQGLALFEALVEQLRSETTAIVLSDPESSPEFAAARTELVRWIHPLSEHAVELRLRIDRLTGHRDRADALVQFQESVEPYIREELLPIIDAYRHDAEEELGDEIGRAAKSAATTSRLLAAAVGIATVLSLVLGAWVWRSLALPLRSLTGAAERFGGGDLDARVPVNSTDELGSLALAFNSMAARLRESMVSIDNLNVVKNELAGSLREKELLLKEIHHRVKNNLQIISSLLELQSSRVTDREALERFSESRNRIRSMALIHEQLYRATDQDRIDMSAYLGFLVSGLVQSTGSSSQNVDIRVEAEPVSVEIDQAVSCGLIVNELVTNSLKHAFLGRPGGIIEVSFGTRAGRGLLEVADDGVGMGGKKEPGGDSLGLDLVRALSEQLSGTVSVAHETGTRFCIEFPVSERRSA